jgi:divalent metal cation (Fe/Co/Zn/Cd) transporter
MTGAMERARWERRAVWLAWATVGYNAIEAMVAITSGVAAGSVALVSFGGDSIVECLSALVIVWQFRGLPEEREHGAMKGIALAFFALAAYITIDSTRSLITGNDPDSSLVGIALAATSLIVMPLLVVAKRRTARALGSATVMADSVQTLLCTYLSAVLLVGLAVNALFGWAWADPVAALIIGYVAVREGVEAWRGEDDCP